MSQTPRIVPTGEDRGEGWVGPVRLAGAALAVILVGALGLAWAQDRQGPYPGYRTPAAAAAVKVRVEPPTNAEVDPFDVPGRLRSVGPWPWQAAIGPAWLAIDGFGRAPTTGGVAVVDPARADVVVQVDVFRPVAGAGVVFRWAGAADHWAVEVASGRGAWVLVRTVAGRRDEVGRFATSLHGSDVRVTLTATEVLVAIDGQVRIRRSDPALATATAVGLRAPTDETRFEQFAVLAGPG